MARDDGRPDGSGQRQILAIAWRHGVHAGGWRLAVIAVCMVLVGVQPALSAVGLRVVTNGARSHDWTRAAGGMLLIAALTFVVFAAYGLYVPLQTTVTERSRRIFQQEMMALVSSVPTLALHERPEFADQLDLLRDPRALIAIVWRTLSAGSFLIGSLAALGVLARADPVLVLLPLFGVPLFLAARRAQRRREAVAEYTAGDARLAAHLFEIGSLPAYGAELRTFGLGAEVRARYTAICRTVGRTLFRTELVDGLLGAGAWLVFTLAWIGGVVLVVLRVQHGDADVGDVVVTVAVAGLVQGYVSIAVGLVQDSVAAVATARRFLWLRAQAEPSPAATTDTPRRLRRGIDLEHVGYRYPAGRAAVLVDVTVHLPAGATVGLVGANGAGKSTLVNLLLGLHHPSSGRIVVDGQDLSRLDPHRWQARTSATFQDFARLELLLGEAIGVGDLDRIADGCSVRLAQRRAGSDLSIPHASQLGRRWADGVELSGGQWQQVALARGMMRELPLLLVVDEPTAALDPEREYALFQTHRAAMRAAASRAGTITLLVSHRFSTVRFADLILVIEDGRLAEYGSHDELVGSGGMYADLFATNARNYR